ncbi:MAG: hypothetical protein K8H90_07835, partial [Thermoanaerobaculia bacterium]|nr:hypothetical protein [Thermoanaerobaculia bacterium]
MTDSTPGAPPGTSAEPAFGYGGPERRDSSRLLWILAALAVVALVVLRFWDGIVAPFRVEPVAAYVALLPEGETVARDGEHRLAADARFRLFAVLEARTFGGDTVWYT